MVTTQILFQSSRTKQNKKKDFPGLTKKKNLIYFIFDIFLITKYPKTYEAQAFRKLLQSGGGLI